MSMCSRLFKTDNMFEKDTLMLWDLSSRTKRDTFAAMPVLQFKGWAFSCNLMISREPMISLEKSD